VNIETISTTLTPTEVSVILAALTRFGDTKVDDPRNYTADELAAIAAAQTAAADLSTKLESWLTPAPALAVPVPDTYPRSEAGWDAPAISTLAAAYARYQHLDPLLSDPTWLGPEFHWFALADLWQAVKSTVQGDQP